MDVGRRIGVVGVADGWSTQRLLAAAQARADEAVLLEPERMVLDLRRNRLLQGELDLTRLDAVLVKKLGARYSPELLDRLEMLRFLERQGVRVFSRPQGIMHALDRMTCTVTLRLADIPMPATVITEDITAGAAAVRDFGRAVLKPLFTSKARGMEVVSADEDVPARLQAFRDNGNAMMYIQQMVESSGRDFGIAFLGGRYLASYARVKQGSTWHTATSEGGRYEPAEPGDELIALAYRAQAPFELDFTCVDVVETPAGPGVYEVSAFGGFRGLLEAAEVDAAALWVDHVLGTLATT